MKIAPISLIFVPLLACQPPVASKQAEVASRDSQMAAPNEREVSSAIDATDAAANVTAVEWQVSQLIDRLTDEEGVEAKGKVKGASAAA